MKITWLAHSCFMVENGAGVRLLTDPYSEGTGYGVKRVMADIVTTSHQHLDHANLSMVEGSEGEYTLINTTGSFSVQGFEITGIATKHDSEGGAKRGDNIVYVIECDGLRLCHLGDLGHRLNEEQIKAIGKVDFLMIPVGGVFTIDAKMARHVVADLNPMIVMPMHYKADVCKFPIEDEQQFLDLMQQDEYAIIRHHGPIREYLPDQMPRRHAVVVMDHMF